MKETIAIRNKKLHIFSLIVSLTFFLLSALLLIIGLFVKIALVSAILFLISSAVWLFFILDKRGVIFRSNENLSILIGLVKKTVAIKDIKEVSLVLISAKKEKYEKGTVCIKVQTDDKESVIYATEIKNEKETVEKIKSLREKNND